MVASSQCPPPRQRPFPEHRKECAKYPERYKPVSAQMIPAGPGGFANEGERTVNFPDSLRACEVLELYSPPPCYRSAPRGPRVTRSRLTPWLMNTGRGMRHTRVAVFTESYARRVAVLLILVSEFGGFSRTRRRARPAETHPKLPHASQTQKENPVGKSAILRG